MMHTEMQNDLTHFTLGTKKELCLVQNMSGLNLYLLAIYKKNILISISVLLLQLTALDTRPDQHIRCDRGAWSCLERHVKYLILRTELSIFLIFFLSFPTIHIENVYCSCTMPIYVPVTCHFNFVANCTGNAEIHVIVYLWSPKRDGRVHRRRVLLKSSKRVSFQQIYCTCTACSSRDLYNHIVLWCYWPLDGGTVRVQIIK